MFNFYCKIEIFGDPVPKSLVQGVNKIANSPKTQIAMNRRIMAIKNYMCQNNLKPIPKDKAIKIEIIYFHEPPKSLKTSEMVYKITKPDIDNLTKLMLDCCTQANLWHDDSQVVYTILQDVYSTLDKKPKTVIIVSVGSEYEQYIDSP